MLAGRIANIVDFAQGLHRDAWCITRLPDDLNARLFVRETGTDLLGVAVQGKRRAIGLNAAIVGTPLELPVLAHECGHLLLGHDIGYCSTIVRIHGREERDAWASAALLAIPTPTAIELSRHPRAVPDLAATFGVPRVLAAMRGALAVLLDEVDGDQEHAAATFRASRDSLDRWIARLVKGVTNDQRRYL